jgi:uncharacterized protein YodC (DUF2158 family)
MADQKFYTGQTVKLKSGGPAMTVLGTNSFSLNSMYVCQWFAGKTLKTGEFPAQNLVLTAPEETPKRKTGTRKVGIVGRFPTGR